MKKFRIDNDYENVYKIADDESCYEFYCSFAAAGITRDMSEEDQLAIIREDELCESADSPWGQ